MRAYLFIEEFQVRAALIFAINLVVDFLFFRPCLIIACPLGFLIFIIIIIGRARQWIVVL